MRIKSGHSQIEVTVIFLAFTSQGHLVEVRARVSRSDC